MSHCCHVQRLVELWDIETSRRLAVSFEPLNSSLPLSAPELCMRKAMCDPVVLAQKFPKAACAWRTTPIYMWLEQAIIEWSRRVISIVACCHSVKLCAHATRAFRSQQTGAVARTWRPCQVQVSQKERALGAFRCKKEGMLLLPHCEALRTCRSGFPIATTQKC